MSEPVMRRTQSGLAPTLARLEELNPGAALFEAVQKGLAARNPNVVPPRSVSGPILLTGLAACATCGGG